MSPTPLPPGSSIAIVGAGIVGLSAAYVLSERRYAVTLFDRDEPARTGPSFGNAGHIAAQGIFPLASPGIGLKGMGMLMDPEAPLKIPRAYLPRIAPWLWRFWRTSTGEAQERAITALTELARGGFDETEALWRRTGFVHVLTRQPALYLYDSEASYQLALSGWRRRIASGFASTLLDRSDIRELEPKLAPIFPRGVLSHDYGHVTDPYEVAGLMFKAVRERGVAYERAEVTSIRSSGIVADGAERRFDGVLVTAGAWSRRLAAGIGEHLPVEAERGYNITYPAHRRDISHPLLFADRGIAATPLAPGLRFGGWTELGGVELPPNPQHWARLRDIAEAILPGLGQAEGRTWMGHRPSMPDTVPVISRSGRLPNVFYATGHGHYGLSLSAKTARMLGELIGEAADARYAAYSIGRFN